MGTLAQRWWPLAVVVVLVLVAAWSFWPPSTGTPTVKEAPSFDETIDTALQVWNVPGAAVAIVRDGETVYLDGRGVRDVRTKEPVTADTLFPLASCTKAFTTTAMAMLVDDGKMGWDDPVRKHLPEFHLSDPNADALVILRDLVSHRTGVRGHDFLWLHAPWGQDECIRRVGKLPVDRPFRGSFNYQTTMFTAAGKCVASAAGMPWGEFVRQRVLNPLEMNATTLTYADAEKAPDHASGHRQRRPGLPEVMPWYRLDEPEPAGSICSSVRDLAKWMQFQLGDGTHAGKRLVSQVNLAETHTPHIVIPPNASTKAMNPETLQMSYGMGWLLLDYRGHLLWAHGGTIDGFRSYIVLVPKKKLGIALLNNKDQTQMNLALANDLLDRLLDLPRQDWNRYYLMQVLQGEKESMEKRAAVEKQRQTGAKPTHELKAYAGIYEDPAYGTAEVKLDNGTLIWSWSSFKRPLVHLDKDGFTLDDEDLGFTRVEFGLGPKGEVETMKASGRIDATFRKKQ